MADIVDTDELLYQIITDKRHISATDSVGQDVDLLVRTLMPSERVYATYIYNRALKKARKLGVPTQKECMADAIAKGYWTKDKERLIKLYEMEIDKLEKELEFYKDSPNKGKRIKFTNNIKAVQNKLNAVLAEQDSHTFHSAENQASAEKMNYIVSRILLNIDGTQHWPLYIDFLKERDSHFIASALKSYSSLSKISEKDVRSIARSSTWSIMWNASKKSVDTLFDKPTSQYSPEQAVLIYWALMYDSVYESMDKPSDKIIENDELLDKWFEQQKKTREKESKQKRATKSSKMDKHPEIFIMANTDEEADDIWDLNDEWTLARIQKEAETIEKSNRPFLTEYELRRGYIKKQLVIKNADKFATTRKEHAKRSFG